MTGKHQFKTGDIVVIYGRTSFDRELVTYTDAKAFVSHIRKKDYPNNDDMSNEDYMRTILQNIQEHNEGFTVPTHNEEAFVSALFRLGLCDKTQLN